jgi:hypothetical protein
MSTINLKVRIVFTIDYNRRVLHFIVTSVVLIRLLAVQHQQQQLDSSANGNNKP